MIYIVSSIVLIKLHFPSILTLFFFVSSVLKVTFESKIYLLVDGPQNEHHVQRQKYEIHMSLSAVG